MRAILMTLLAAGMAGCAGPGPEKAEAYTFTVHATGNTMADMAYNVTTMHVSEGAEVTINLVNQGTDAAMLHNFVVVKQGSEKEVALEGINLKAQHYFNPENPDVIAGSAIAGPGATASLKFTAPARGTYTYLCTYPGHWMKMQGTLVVE